MHPIVSQCYLRATIALRCASGVVVAHRGHKETLPQKFMSGPLVVSLCRHPFIPYRILTRKQKGLELETRNE